MSSLLPGPNEGKSKLRFDKHFFARARTFVKPGATLRNIAVLAKSVVALSVHRISAVHPFYYLAAYLVSIPLFAALYVQIPGGFYAPYAHLEKIAENDAEDARYALQEAILNDKRVFAAHSSDEISLTPISYVAEIHAVTDSAISFNIQVEARAPEGFVNFPWPITLSEEPAGFFIKTQSSNGSKVAIRVVTLNNANWPPSRITELQHAAFNKLFGSSSSRLFGDSEFSDRGGMIQLTDLQNAALDRLFAGLKGDALSVSGAYPRMLYFSAVTITTVGFGDIVPIMPISRAATAFEAIFGVILIGLVLNAVAYRASKP